MPAKHSAPQSAQQCHHPLVRKAYYLGLPGEGYVYTRCGQAMPRPAVAARENAPLRAEQAEQAERDGPA